MNQDDHGENTNSKFQVWVGRVISALICFLLTFSAIGKFRAGPEGGEMLDHIGFELSMLPKLATLELACVVLYAIPQTSMVGAILLTGYMGGAICTHWRVGDPFIIQTIIPILVWLGLYLREHRLRELLPLRASS